MKINIWFFCKWGTKKWIFRRVIVWKMFDCSLKESNQTARQKQKVGQEYALMIAAFWFATPCRLTEHTFAPISISSSGLTREWGIVDDLCRTTGIKSCNSHVNYFNNEFVFEISGCHSGEACGLRRHDTVYSGTRLVINMSENLLSAASGRKKGTADVAPKSG